MSKTYAGIGSRRIPEDIAQFMSDLAYALGYSYWVLRSGGAEGADRAFEVGARQTPTPPEIFTKDDTNLEAMSIASRFHPVWHLLTPHQKEVIARNTFQILGRSLDDPVKFVICWTPDAANGTDIPTTKETGGTGQAIRIAASMGIPIFNLANPSAKRELRGLLERIL